MTMEYSDITKEYIENLVGFHEHELEVVGFEEPDIVVLSDERGSVRARPGLFGKVVIEYDGEEFEVISNAETTVDSIQNVIESLCKSYTGDIASAVDSITN